MTDTDPFDPTKDPDVQEGRSRIYGSATIMILPLASGNLAVFGQDRKLHTILYDAPSMEDLRRLSRELQAKLMAQRVLDAEAKFHGEPTDKQMARDIRGAQNQRPRTPARNIEPMEL